MMQPKTGYFRLALRPHALGTVKKVTAKMMRQDPLYFITSNQIQGSTSMDSPKSKEEDRKKDDWTEIKVKKYIAKVVIGSFEKNRDENDVYVEYHRKNGLDGKVSYIEVVAP